MGTRTRTRKEMAATFVFSLDRPQWLWWNLQRERISCQDEDDTDSLWYDNINRTIAALNQYDWAEVERLVNILAESQGIESDKNE